MAAPIHLEVLADLFNKIDPQPTLAIGALRMAAPIHLEVLADLFNKIDPYRPIAPRLPCNATCAALNYPDL